MTAHNCAMAVFNTIKVKKILCYETPSTLPSFSPNLLKFYDNEKFKVKLNALQCHKSQIGKPYFSTETIFSIAKMRAAQGKCFNGLAEAYEVVRINEF